MKLNTQSIMSELDRCGIALADRGYLLSVAIARAVAYQLPLPTSPVESPAVYFIETHKATAEGMLCEINERCVMNIDAAASLMQNLWIFRYRMVFDCNNAACRGFLDAMVRVGSRELPPAVSELMTKYESSESLDLVTRAVGMAIEEA